jgi:hypothetical protein
VRLSLPTPPTAPGSRPRRPSRFRNIPHSVWAMFALFLRPQGHSPPTDECVESRPVTVSTSSEVDSALLSQRLLRQMLVPPREASNGTRMPGRHGRAGATSRRSSQRTSQATKVARAPSVAASPSPLHALAASAESVSHRQESAASSLLLPGTPFSRVLSVEASGGMPAALEPSESELLGFPLPSSPPRPRAANDVSVGKSREMRARRQFPIVSGPSSGQAAESVPVALLTDAPAIWYGSIRTGSERSLCSEPIKFDFALSADFLRAVLDNVKGAEEGEQATESRSSRQPGGPPFPLPLIKTLDAALRRCGAMASEILYFDGRLPLIYSSYRDEMSAISPPDVDIRAITWDPSQEHFRMTVAVERRAAPLSSSHADQPFVLAFRFAVAPYPVIVCRTRSFIVLRKESKEATTLKKVHPNAFLNVPTARIEGLLHMQSAVLRPFRQGFALSSRVLKGEVMAAQDPLLPGAPAEDLFSARASKRPADDGDGCHRLAALAEAASTDPLSSAPKRMRPSSPTPLDEASADQSLRSAIALPTRPQTSSQPVRPVMPHALASPSSAMMVLPAPVVDPVWSRKLSATPQPRTNDNDINDDDDDDTVKREPSSHPSWLTSLFTNPLSKRLAGLDSVPGFVEALDQDIETEQDKPHSASAALALPSTSIDTTGDSALHPLRAMSSVSFGRPVGWESSL